MRLKMLVKLSCHLIFICIHRIKSSVLIQRTDDLIKSIGRKQIVMIQKSHKFSPGHLKSRICVSCNPLIFCKFTDPDTTVFFCVLFQDLFHCSILRTSICNTKLPVSIGLSKKRVYHLSQKLFRCTVCRHCHTDQRTVLKMVVSLFLKRCFIRHISLIPRSVRNFLRLKSFVKPYPELLWSVMLQIAESLLYGVGTEFF